MSAYTLRGNRVQIIDWSTDAYLCRFDNGVAKWIPRSLMRSAVTA